MNTRICNVCQKEKPLTQFYKNSSLTDKIDRKCKDCKNKHVKEWYENNKEKRKEILKKNRQKKKDSTPPKPKKERKEPLPKKPRSKKEKPTKIRNIYQRSVTVLLTNDDFKLIERKCSLLSLDKSTLIRELIRKNLLEFEFTKQPEIVLQPINLTNFKIDGYSEGVQ